MFFNTSDFIGLIIINFTNNVSGDIFLTLLSLLFAIIMFFLALRIPLELTTILILPLLIIFMAYSGGDWKPVAGIMVLYLSIVFGRFFFR